MFLSSPLVALVCFGVGFVNAQIETLYCVVGDGVSTTWPTLPTATFLSKSDDGNVYMAHVEEMRTVWTASTSTYPTSDISIPSGKRGTVIVKVNADGTRVNQEWYYADAQWSSLACEIYHDLGTGKCTYSKTMGGGGALENVTYNGTAVPFYTPSMLLSSP